MKKTITVTVTANDIEAARKALKSRPGAIVFRSQVCPIAQAFQRKFSGRHVSVGDCYATVGKKTVDLPVKAWHFISRFDSHKSVKPFRFTVRV